MRNIAIIPARSGSKGLKDKNIKLLNGKPLLAYTIEAARDSKLFDEIMVSTDSKEYADIAKKWGAHVPFLRSEVLSNDTASSWDVVKDVLKKYNEQGEDFDTVTLLQPTSPLRTSNDIVQGYTVMNDKHANYVVSVSEMDHSPLWSNVLPQDHSLENFLNKEHTGKPRQQLPSYYRINGALYIVKTDYLMKADDIYKEKSFATIMAKENSIDIDDEIDFIIANALINRRG